MSVSALPRIDAPAVQRHRPRTRLPEAATALVNRLARPRLPFEASVEGLPLRLAVGTVLLEPAPPIADAVDLGLAVAGERLALRLPGAVLDQLARALQPDLGTLPDGPAGPLLLELALAPLLEAAEGIAGTPITIETVAPASNAAAPSATLRVEGHLAGEPFPVQLDLGHLPDAPPLDALLALVEAAHPRAAPVAALPLAVRFVAGHTWLTLRQFASLEPGDAVLPDFWLPARGETRATLGDHLVATARTDRHTSTLRTPFRPAAEEPAAARGVSGMTQDQAAQEAEPQAGLDAVGVALTFELGRRTLALSDLKAVGEGHVFDLGLDPRNPIDLIANGARIGQGEIVEIGERIGVRVVRLFGRD